MATKIKSPIKKTGAEQGWTAKPGDMYEVTGVDRDGKKFKITTHSWQHAQGINVWRGTKWLVRDGHRHIIQRIYNG
jgi:hypothetical protein